jgi:hypothetical protein
MASNKSAKEVRHRCRNPRCRDKLPAPVSNAREAFCRRGCYNSFYRRHCLICERHIEQPKRGRRLICGKVKCRRAFRNNCWLGRYHTSSAAKSTSKEANFIGVRGPHNPDRPWRIVAGPELSASAFHCAAVRGEETVKAINRANAGHWRDANAELEEETLIKRHHPPVNILSGYKFPGAPVIDLTPIVPPSTPAPSVLTGDPLDIPDFLRRVARPPEALAAQNSPPQAAPKKTEDGGKAGQSATRAQRPRRQLRGRA